MATGGRGGRRRRFAGANGRATPETASRARPSASRARCSASLILPSISWSRRSRSASWALRSASFSARAARSSASPACDSIVSSRVRASSRAFSVRWRCSAIRCSVWSSSSTSSRSRWRRRSICSSATRNSLAKGLPSSAEAAARRAWSAADISAPATPALGGKPQALDLAHAALGVGVGLGGLGSDDRVVLSLLSSLRGAPPPPRRSPGGGGGRRPRRAGTGGPEAAAGRRAEAMRREVGRAVAGRWRRGRRARGPARDRCPSVRRRRPHRPPPQLRLRHRAPSSGPTSRRIEASESERRVRPETPAAAPGPVVRCRWCRHGLALRGGALRLLGLDGAAALFAGLVALRLHLGLVGLPFKLLLFALGLAIERGFPEPRERLLRLPAGEPGLRGPMPRRQATRPPGPGWVRPAAERAAASRGRPACVRPSPRRVCASAPRELGLVLSLTSSRARFFSSRSRFLRSFGVSATAVRGASRSRLQASPPERRRGGAGRWGRGGGGARGRRRRGTGLRAPIPAVDPARSLAFLHVKARTRTLKQGATGMWRHRCRA